MDATQAHALGSIVMARGAASPAPNALPKVSFVRVTDEVTQQPPGVHDHIAKSYGYNDFNDEFVLPEEHYIRYIEPLESDLAIQVEYDMDEQDQEWLDAVNQERKAQQLDKVSYETFEIIMDRLEKEWFDLSKNIPKSDMALPSEDSTCAICDDSEGENTNAIVFCDGCNLAVHQDCYGVPYIPEGQWLCRKCTVSPENPVSCILCPNEGGAFKQTVSGEWVHLLCAIWIPETTVANEVFMEPVTGIEKISKQRWKLVSQHQVCGIREGACIQCSKPSCFTAFHATCARKEKLLMPMKAAQGSEAPTLAAYCERHLPREQQEARASALRAQRTDGSDTDDGQTNAKSNKSARAYAKTYKPGPPLVPRIIVNRILQYISRISIRHKTEFVQLVCRYWSLKREARRGAPLLKRLHLEPWTASSGTKQQTDEEKAMKLELMRKLRLDLERVRLIIDVIRHRELTKQRQQEQIQAVLSRFFFPHEPALRFAFEKVISHDRQGYFKSPVNRNEVPDYYDIIREPMCWDIIDRRLDSHEYLDLAEFKRDVELVVTNAMMYNQANTPFYRTALRIQSNLPNIFSDLDKALSVPQPPKLEAAQTENEQDGPSIQSPPPEYSRPMLGDLEPSLGLLEMLVSEELIRQDTNIIMVSAPIQALINYELPNIRPPAPPPPPLKSAAKSGSKSKKQKVDRKTALERKRQERLRALDLSPGFRAPRTRAAMAAAVAFEAEASGDASATAADAHAESSSAASAGQGTGQTASTSVEKPARKPRKSAGTPAQDIPLTVEEVDNRKSFAMFERGWILPPDHKRGGRVPVERQPLPPPKKKVKTSRRSVSSSAPVERGSSLAAQTEASAQVAQDADAGDNSASDRAVLSMLDPQADTQASDVPQFGAAPGSASETSTPELSSVAVQPRVPGVDQAEDTAMEVDKPPEADATRAEEPQAISTESQSYAHDLDAAQGHKSEDCEHDRASEQITAHLAEPEPELEGEHPQAEPKQRQVVPEQPQAEAETPGPRRIIIIEELDTPATRREKNMRKKRERQAAREAAARAAAAGRSVPSAPRQEFSVAGSSRQPQQQDSGGAGLGGDDSDLTDLSDGEENTPSAVDIPMSAGPGVLQTPGQGPVVVRSSRRQPPPPPATPAELEAGAINLKPGERLEGGTLVWAKIESYPWWPAVVFEEDDPEVPPSVLARAPSPEPDLELVKFYEKKHINNWAWVKHKNMRYLGEDDRKDALAEMDIEHAENRDEPPAKRQRTRPSRASARQRPESTNEKRATSASPAEDLVPAAMGTDSPMTDVDDTFN
ncbi:hypothetical protein BN946_scf184851.g88 [Trametes cinnabarina]|uniref:Peregrin n=1 Tax=Pycnoporus cinnabarinus TaxID=5643 RepID=A0A060S5S1_PYCCI|nr:hypothetical protein BN946_scf184851.g88 [Trametes cinnabarina]